MGKKRVVIPPCCKKYGLPLYCASWVPLNKIEENNPKEEQVEGKGKEVSEEKFSSAKGYLVLGGGGGEGRSGISNALLLAQFDFSNDSLSDQPVDKLGTNGDVPYRMSVHPGGEGFICSFPKSCRWFEWDVPERTTHKITPKSSEKMLTQLEDVGMQLALTFNSEGSILAAGGEDGHLRVFKWPSMDVILDQTDAHATVKDLDFSFDGKFLVSLGSSGPCRVWDLSSSTVVANLPRENGEIFGFCRFSRSSDNQILYVTSMKGQQGSIVPWNTNSWKRAGSKQIVRDPVSAFNVSADGKLLAIGTIEGDIAIINSTNMQMQMKVRKAHLGIITAVMFSQDSSALVSTSFDSSVRVTLIKDKKKNGMRMWVIIVVILFAIIAYLMKQKGALL
ncbi:SEC12-like protein 2 [Tasmannia lanceolata]|uniref:SEC12-like protein 2 n=1 Tax=Tasmannia lanceolata TaxID=3420 RepID=UPI004063249C